MIPMRIGQCSYARKKSFVEGFLKATPEACKDPTYEGQGSYAGNERRQGGRAMILPMWMSGSYASREGFA